MGLGEEISNSTKSASDLGKDFAEKSYEYYKLKIFHVLTSFVSSLTKSLIIGGLITLGLIFFSIASAIALGEYLDNVPLGFIYVGLVFVLLGLLIILLKGLIDKKVIKSISKQFYKQNNTI